MQHLSIDLETFSSVNIKKSGLYKYVQSPDFEILLCAYSIDDRPTKIIDFARGEYFPDGFTGLLLDPNVIKHAYNAAFEWYSLSKYLDIEKPAEWLPQWQCTQFHGLYCGYPMGLAKIGEAMGLPQDKKKLGIGSSLIRLFCVPCKPSKSNGERIRTLPQHEPEKWELFKNYCIGDVISEKEIENRLSSFPVPENEQQLWQLDQELNAYGVAMDQELINGALYCDETVTAELMNEAVTITGLENPKSPAQLKKWLEQELNDDEVEIKSLTKDTVKSLLGITNDDTVRRILKIRQELSKTSTKKYVTMKTMSCDDGKIRGLMQIYGANRTGRWCGRGVQPQNLPQNHLAALNWAREAVKAKHIEDLKTIYGNIPDTLSQLIRTAFIAPLGKVFIPCDFSAIEARIIAWLAGEEWVCEVFRGDGKIYEATAAAMFKVPSETITKDHPNYALRAKGKVATLACGFGGGVPALKKMGADKMGLTDDEMLQIVRQWREANPNICNLWHTLESAAIKAVATGQSTMANKGIIFAREISDTLDFLTAQLPNGRKLYYILPQLQTNKWGKPEVTYMGVNQITKKWERLNTYGGKLAENCVQGIARDCLAVNLQRVSKTGYKVPFHIHDELVCEAPEENGEEHLKKIEAIMGQPIPWAPDLLLRAEGFISKYYRKG